MKRLQKVEYYVAGLVALLTLIIYLVTLQNDFVLWDDSIYVFENMHIRSFNTAFFKWAFFDFYAANWHPLTWISHALDYAVWGLNPLGHHLTSIILHAANTFIVVFLIIRLLEAWKETTKSDVRPEPLTMQTILITGGVTGLLFGLHPLHVESVAWIAERKDLLCALFFFLSVIRYIKYVMDVKEGTAEKKLYTRRLNKHYLLSVVFFILALMSKPMAVTLPVVLLLLDWFPLNRIRSFKTFLPALVEKLPFIALSLGSSVLTIFAQRMGGAMDLMDTLPFSTRLLVALKSLIAYLGNIILPLNLIPFYSYPKHVLLLAPGYLSAIALIFGITAACMILAKKQKLWLAAWGYFVITLIPVLGIMQVGDQSMADRYTYLPSLGPFLVLGLIAAWIWAKVIRLQRWRLIAKASTAGMAVFVFAALSFLTFTQIGIWKNSIDLWSCVIRKEPEEVPLAYNNRGLAYERKGLFKEAMEDLNRAIILKPSYHLAYNNRGMVLGMIGQYDAALRDFTMTIALDPGSYEAYSNRAFTYEKMGQFEKALEDYNTAVTLNPSFQDAFYHLGILYGKMKLYSEAIQALGKSLALNPNNANAYSNRGVMYSFSGQPENALEDFSKAIALNQSFTTAYINRGNLYLKIGRKDLAFADFQRACSLGDAIGCKALY